MHIGDPLFNAYDPLQDFEYFSRSLGFTSDWALPSESDLTQFIIKEPNFHGIPTLAPSHGQQHRSQQEQLTQLPVEKDTISECAPYIPICMDSNNQSGIQCPKFSNPDGH